MLKNLFIVKQLQDKKSSIYVFFKIEDKLNLLYISRSLKILYGYFCGMKDCLFFKREKITLTSFLSIWPIAT